MRHLRTLLPALALVLAVAGCGDDSDDAGDNDTPDSPTSSAPDAPTDQTDAETEDTGDGDAGSCYLSDADVAAATGIEATAVDNSLSGTTICSWTSTTGDNINLSVKQETGTFDATVSATEGVIGPSEPLDGVGDEAAIFYGSEIVPQAAVLAQAGDQLISVIYTASSGDEAALRAAVTDLTTKVVENL